MKAAVIVCSDSVASGDTQDTTGPVLADGLRDLDYEVVPTVTVPDDVDTIALAVREAAGQADLVVCTGGTGIGPRDVTPEAVISVIDRELPGFGEAFRAAGRAKTPLADLSRAVAGMNGSTMVVALPGSRGAVIDGLAVLGPLLGHAHNVAHGADHRALVRTQTLSVAEVESVVRDDAIGAAVIFEGRVRDHDHGRPVLSLEYEGHPDADQVMRDVLDEARQRPGVQRAAALHRLGHLEVGDLAFIAAVGAAHRKEAFEACAWLVDEIKARLPVWKLQHFADGSQEWVNCA